jgi:hypothetical protein
VFQQQDSSGSTVQVAERPAGGTTKFDTPMTVRQADGSAQSGSPVALSDPNEDLESDTPADNPPKGGTGPRVAISANGEAVVAWSGFDGTSFRVEVSLFVPVQVSTGGGGVPAGQPIPTPPPPPPPPPEVDSPIQLARPQKRDMATVLVANVPDDTRQLQWSFGSTDEPPIVGDVVNGRLQRSVRLRLPGTSFTATLRIVGPNGTRTVSRSLGSFQPSSTQDSKAVQHGLARADTPPVFAVGQTDVLTGNQTRTRAGQSSSSCAPMSVWSGQQKMTGCLRPIENLGDIPNLERGAIHELASQLHLDETRADLMQKATQLTDGYVAQGKALLNDTFPVTPQQASQLVNIPQAKALVAARAELPVGSATFDPKNGFNLKIDPKKVKIPLGPLPKPPKLPSLGGLEIVGSWDVDLDKRQAKIKASLKLPAAITKAGIQFNNSIELTATPDRVIVDRASIGPIDVDIGALNVKAFKISYDRALDEWDGQAQACAIVAVCISMAPPDGHITLSHGKVTFAGASVRFPPPGIELFPGVDLSKIGFGMGFDPTRLIGSGQISAVEIIGLDGKFLLAFPSSRAPFILRRDEVGNDFAPDLYGQSFTRTTIGMAGGASFMVPETDESLEFAKAYLIYEYPGYIALGGGGHIDIIGIIQLDGSLSAAMDIPAKRFNIHGDLSACFFESKDLCGGAIANVSHGPHKEGGAGACIKIGPFNIGGGVQWARITDPFIWPLDGCKWSRFAIDVRPSAARAGHMASLYTLTVRQGEPNPVLKYYGKGGAPLLRVTGPSGQLLDGTSSKGLDLSPGGKIRILRYPGNKLSGPATVVGLENAQPGRYTVEALPSSPPIIGSAHAFDQPDAKVSGKVVGTGRHRVLLYNVLSRKDQKVTFQEVEPSGAAKTIGVITGGGRGQIPFDSAPGLGIRRVVAQFELDSLPAERKVITRFKPQSPRIGKPHRITVRRKGGNVFVSWRPVAGATRYEVAARLSNLRTIFKNTARTKIRLRISRWFSGRVTVRAIDDLRLSDVGHGLHGFRAISSPPSGFRTLLSCRVTKRSIGCARPRRRASRPRSL